MSLEDIYGSERAGSVDPAEPCRTAAARLRDPAGHRTDERWARAAEHRHLVWRAGPPARGEMDRALQGTGQLSRPTGLSLDRGGAPEPAHGSGAAEASHARGGTALGAEGDITHARVLSGAAAPLSRRTPL